MAIAIHIAEVLEFISIMQQLWREFVDKGQSQWRQVVDSPSPSPRGSECLTYNVVMAYKAIWHTKNFHYD